MFNRKRREVEVSPYDLALIEVREATTALHRAETNFANALPGYFEIANNELTISRMRLDAAIQKIKMYPS